MRNLSQSTGLPSMFRWNLRVEKLKSADRPCALAEGQAGLILGTGEPGPEWVR